MSVIIITEQSDSKIKKQSLEAISYGVALAKQLNIDIEKSKNGQATLFRKFFANLNLLPKDSNTKIKVIRINPVTNKPWESVSLCPIKLKEFELETWEQSN